MGYPTQYSADQPTSQESVDGPAHEPGKPLGQDAPPLASLEGQLCGNCKVGVLEVTRYDPSAIHERDQGNALLIGHESGGAFETRCRYCDYTESHALNPGTQWGK